jgi:hypothetical protein
MLVMISTTAAQLKLFAYTVDQRKYLLATFPDQFGIRWIGNITFITGSICKTYVPIAHICFSF